MLKWLINSETKQVILYEWVAESLTHLIHPVTNHRRVLIRDAQHFRRCFDWNYFCVQNLKIEQY